MLVKTDLKRSLTNTFLNEKLNKLFNFTKQIVEI